MSKETGGILYVKSYFSELPPPQACRLTRHIGFWKNFNGAFTLAEVLITLGIIGVVAALTMPTLIAKQQEKQTVVKLKKVYSILSQAYTSAVNEQGCTIDSWGLGSGEGNANPEGNDKLANILKKYLKVSTFCGSDLYTDCWRGSTKHISNIYYETPTANRHSKMLLNDGTMLAFITQACENYICGRIYADIKGNRGPNNILGKDVFIFNIKKEGIFPSSLPSAGEFSNSCNRNQYSGGCAGWVIYNENMDYLHCDGLSWDGAKTCKELKAN